MGKYCQVNRQTTVSVVTVAAIIAIIILQQIPLGTLK